MHLPTSLHGSLASEKKSAACQLGMVSTVINVIELSLVSGEHRKVQTIPSCLGEVLLS